MPAKEESTERGALPQLKAASFIGGTSLLALVANPLHPNRKTFRGWLVGSEPNKLVMRNVTQDSVPVSLDVSRNPEGVGQVNWPIRHSDGAGKDLVGVPMVELP